MVNQQFKRNKNKFPEDFMFCLTKQEYDTLLSQLVISRLKCLNGYGIRRQSCCLYRYSGFC
ncbi:MAG: ORF6N domain-containing protein [Spirochaetes bacterium]|nr:ORF6N domain-containing protein [Spirochaetota bacterium]